MEPEDSTKTAVPSKKKLQEFCEKNMFNSVQFVSESKSGTVIYYILFFLPIPFLVYLLDRWLNQRIKLYFCYKEVANLDDADTVVIVDQGENVNFEAFGKQALHTGEELPKFEAFTFVFLNIRYVLDAANGQFETISDIFCRETVAEGIRRYRFGRYTSEVPALLETYCENKIAVAKPSIVDMLISDILSFMGAFELSCLTLIIVDGSRIYLVFLVCLISFSKVMMILDGFHQYDRIQRYLMLSDGVITIRKNADDCFAKLTISNHSLVPGDIIELTTNLKIAVDAVLISGSCMADEKDISGDSIPRVKFAVDEECDRLLSDVPENHLARSGANCVFTRTEISDSVLAIVIRTGYNTEKGKIMRSVLMPKVVKFRFFDEAVVFVYIMATISIIGSLIYMVYKLYFLTELQFSLKKLVVNMFGLFFSAVKPVLPFSLYLGLEASKDRLESKGISCSNKYKINECGRTDTIFFDKTGTLTKDNSVFNGMFVAFGKPDGQKPDLAHMTQLSHIRQTEEQRGPADPDLLSRRDLPGPQVSPRRAPRPGGKAEEEFQSQIFRQKLGGPSQRFLNIQQKLQKGGVHFSGQLNSAEELFRLGSAARNYLFCLSFCNNLIISGAKVVGDNIDLEMHRFSPYTLQNYTVPRTRVLKKRYQLAPEKSVPFDMPGALTVERTFDYSADFKSEAIVLVDDRGRYFMVVKGPPEEVALLCDPETIPTAFGATLYEVCASGARVLGLAMRELGGDESVLSRPREELVAGLTFCGLFALDNPLKNEAAEVIGALTRNLIRCVLITGDNIFTAISIAARSSLLPPGKALYLGDLLENPQAGTAELQWADFDYSQSIPKKARNPDEDFEEEELLEDASQAPAPLEVRAIRSIEDLINLDVHSSVLALTGNAYDFLIEQYQAKLTAKHRSLFELVHSICLVYGRCDAYQKSRVVRNQRLFQKTRYPIGYVGDGANDTEAMKFADVSLLISQADISFAAPFSSNDGSLTRVLELIKEGKNNVESGYQNFKFFIFLTCGQFVATFLLYLRYIGFNIYQSMFMDIAVFMILCGMSDTFWHKKKLNRYKPKSSILVFNILFPLFCHLVMASVLLAVAYRELAGLSFYKPPQHIFSDEDKADMNIDLEAYKFYDNHFLFCLMNLFFVSYFVFSNFQNAFRVKLIKNTKVVLYLVGFFLFMIYLCNLSQMIEPNFLDNVFISFFGILKTYRTNRIYVRMTVAYWLCAFFIEKISDTIHSYRENVRFNKAEKKFIQAAPEPRKKRRANDADAHSNVSE